MTGLRLVPLAGKVFPYERALRLLKTMPTVELDPLDIPALVAAGKKMGWSQVVIEHHWTMMANGKCFRFDQDDEPELSGIWHVASEPITKYELLKLVDHHYHLGVDLACDEKFTIDRRLDGSRFRARTGYSPPSWDDMISNMRADPTPYGQ